MCVVVKQETIAHTPVLTHSLCHWKLVVSQGTAQERQIEYKSVLFTCAVSKFTTPTLGVRPDRKWSVYFTSMYFQYVFSCQLLLAAAATETDLTDNNNTNNRVQAERLLRPKINCCLPAPDLGYNKRNTKACPKHVPYDPLSVATGAGSLRGVITLLVSFGHRPQRLLNALDSALKSIKQTQQ